MLIRLSSGTGIIDRVHPTVGKGHLVNLEVFRCLNWTAINSIVTHNGTIAIHESSGTVGVGVIVGDAVCVAVGDAVGVAVGCPTKNMYGEVVILKYRWSGGYMVE